MYICSTTVGKYNKPAWNNKEQKMSQRITKPKFVELIEKYRPLIKGKGRDIADGIGMDYNKFQNYIKGYGNDEAVFEEILNALENYRDELISYIEENFAE